MRVSIVTVCYNSEKTIEKALESVISQLSEDTEYIIVDGVSKDNTLTIIKHYRDLENKNIQVISEPDKGWYDAMNKGIKASKGDFILFLNSDDALEDGILKKVTDFLDKREIPTSEIVYGDSTNIYINDSGEKIYRLIKAPNPFNPSHCRGIRDGMCGIRHQSMFVGREVYALIGCLNLKYKYHADWDFMIRTLKGQIKYNYLPENISYYSMYGASTHSTVYERHLVRKDNGLYKIIDLTLVKDVIGPKRMIQKLLGKKKWNSFMCWYHIKVNKASIGEVK